MTAGGIVAELNRRGVRLEVHGDRLRYFPRSAVGPELAERLKSRKAEIMAFLTAGSSSNWAGSGPAVPPEVMTALLLSTVDWSDTDNREERLAIILEGCGIDPTAEIDSWMLLKPQPDP